MKKVNEVCKLILKLKKEDITEMKEAIKSQSDFTHPFKSELQTKQNKLGEYNNAILDKITELKTMIEAGADI
jgi:hypothetical protein